MKLAEWLENKGKNESVTFVVAKAVKRDFTPGYDFNYIASPIRTVWEWLESESTEKYIVINADHPPIDITGNWVRKYKQGHLQCAVITTEKDLYTMYSERQAKDMIEFYDKEVRK